MNKIKVMGIVNKFKPILIFLIIFILDKILLFPEIQRCCLRDGINTFSYSKNQDKSLLDNSLDINKLELVAIGSSLSYGFHLNKSKTFQDTLNRLSATDREKINKYNIYNISIPAASILTHYVKLRELLNTNFKPDLIIIELAPNSFNPNSNIYEKEIHGGFTPDFIYKYYREIPIEHLKTYLFGSLFVSSRYSIGFPKIKINNAQAQLIYNTILNNKKDIDLPGKNIKEESQIEEFLVLEFLKGIKSNFKNYFVDPSLKEYFYNIISICKEKNIKVVFWSPYLHPKIIEKENELYNKKNWYDFIEQIRKEKINYIDMNLSDHKCEFFTDPLHMGASCFVFSLKEITQLESQK